VLFALEDGSVDRRPVPLRNGGFDGRPYLTGTPFPDGSIAMTAGASLLSFSVMSTSAHPALISYRS